MSFTKVLFFVAFIGVSLAATAEIVPILHQESEVDPSGKYHFSYESGDGSKVSQDGELKTVDKEEVEVAQGSFEYKSDDGQVFGVKYVADENGYQPEGAHLPVAPEVPPLIARALAYLATAPPPKE